MDRRSFLHGGGLALAGIGIGAMLPEGVLRLARAREGKLVLICLRGGHDGLSTVLPHGDPDYSPARRPALYVPRDRAIDLNGFASLHPAMAPVVPAWRAGELALVHRVGFPAPTRCHFDDQRVWENGTPEDPKRCEGWLDRYVQACGGGPAVTTEQRSLDLLGGSCAAAIPAGSWEAASWDPRDPDTGRPLFPAEERFSRSLKLCALALLEGGARVARADLDGWDLHEQAAPRHAELLSTLAGGLRALRMALSGAALEPRGHRSIWNDVAVVTTSEFGRTTDENPWGGTDHGHASCVLVHGGRVRGGVYNCDPGTWPRGVMLASGGRALLERTDARTVLGEVLRDHMGAPAAALPAIFPGFPAAATEELGLFAS